MSWQEDKKSQGVLEKFLEVFINRKEPSQSFLHDLINACPRIAWNRRNHWFGVKKRKE
jgi:hypothetical protein